MNKSRIGCLGLLAVFALAGCRGLTRESTDPAVTLNPSDQSGTVGPVSTQVEVKTGETKTIDGTFNLPDGARDGEIVHLEHEDGKTVIYGIAGSAAEAFCATHPEFTFIGIDRNWMANH